MIRMQTVVMGKTRSFLASSVKVANKVVSFIAFCALDLVDFLLCFTFKALDWLIEAEWKPCYCSSAKKAIITCSTKTMVSEQSDESKMVSLGSRELQIDDISDTLFSRPSLVSEMLKLTVDWLKQFKLDDPIVEYCSTFMVDTTIVEMLQGKIGRQGLHAIPRWSDCNCKLCTRWISSSSNSSKATLFVKAQCPNGDKAREDVLFLHGFISSSSIWTETLFPNFSSTAKSNYRLFAVDLLGFGRSPKPSDSLYTLREHLEMIEQSVLEAHMVKSFHVVAHSLGCILALALAVKYPQSIKSLTLLAPPYYPVPKGAKQATQYVMRRVAPRCVWPPIIFGASIACWYEHITRMVCFLICKNHRLWEFLTKLFTRNRVGTFLLETFFCHTHDAAWHTLHNIICGTAGKIEAYLEAVRENLNCKVSIFHGKDDELIPVECSFEVQRKIPRAHLQVIDDKDHITIVVGRQKSFARELEDIWS